jgi:hypothetical protein
MSSKYISQLHDLQTCSIMASKCICVFTLISTSKCISEFNLMLASKCISKLAWLRPPSASPNSLYDGLQVYLSVAQSPNLLSYGLHVHLWVQLDFGLQGNLQTHLIAVSKYIFQFTPSRPPCASQIILNQRLQVLLRLRSTTICSQTGDTYIYTET